jgi:hypothetical protein
LGGGLHRIVAALRLGSDLHGKEKLMMFDLTARCLREAGWGEWDAIQLRASRNVVWLIFRPGDKTPAAVAKMTVLAGDREQARRACATLEYLAPFAGQLSIPRLLATHDTGTAFFHIETAMPGKPLPVELSPSDGALVTALLEKIEGWLERFQALVPRRGSVDAVLGQTLPSIAPGRVPEALLGALTDLLPQLSMVPAVAVHGDLFGGNVLVAGPRVSVIDWNTFHYGSPLEDVLSFAATATFQWKHAGRSADLLWNAFFGSSPLAACTRKAAVRALARFKLSQTLLRPIFMMLLVDRITRGDYGDVPAWNAVAARYVSAGMPAPWATGR